LKLPLEETISGGYRFLFTNIVSVIGTVWLPYLILAAVGVLCGYIVLPPGLVHGDFSHFNTAVLMQPEAYAARGVFFLTNLVVGAMVTVNLMRHALGQKPTTTFVHFSLRAPVWRMVGAYLLAIIVIVLLVVVLAIAGTAAGYAAFQRMEPAAAIATVVLIASVLICVVAYCFARFFFFLPAVVVAEERIGLGRSWSLGGGNFWRMAVVWLLIAIPVWFVVGVALQVTILPVILSAASTLPRHPSPEELQPLLLALIHALPIFAPVTIAAGIAIRAFMAGAVGTAYKVLTAPKEDSV
jgi:hypothetical protein